MTDEEGWVDTVGIEDGVLEGDDEGDAEIFSVGEILELGLSEPFIDGLVDTLGLDDGGLEIDDEGDAELFFVGDVVELGDSECISDGRSVGAMLGS